MRSVTPGWFAALALALAGLAGCGGDGLNEVTGTVTVDNAQLDNGQISFVPADGKGVTSGGIIKDGKYTVRAAPGMSKVQISAPKVVGKKKLYNTPNSPEGDITKEFLPEKYNEKTELTYEVKSGRQEKDWSLSSK